LAIGFLSIRRLYRMKALAGLTGSQFAGRRFLGVAVLALLAGGAGGWLQGWWPGRQEPSESDAGKLREEEVRFRPKYAGADEVGLRGTVRPVTFPAGCKVRIRHCL